MITVFILIIGFICLVLGADLFVDGSSGLARNFKIPGLIIGLTIVALGTSAPELAVSTVAAVQGSNEIALSNVVGSNIFNLLCVLGLCAIIHPVPVEDNVLKRDFVVAAISTLFVLSTSCAGTLIKGNFLNLKINDTAGIVSRLLAGILIFTFVIYIVYLIMEAQKNPEPGTTVETTPSIWKCIVFIIAGLAMIICSGETVVYSAKIIARSIGITETLIGLTFVAVGTSLPELVTSVVAARKGETELAFGNVIGSNIFNLMFILGVSAVINPVAVNVASMYDLIILVFVTILSFLFSKTDRKLNRMEGIVMLILYVADVMFAIYR